MASIMKRQQADNMEKQINLYNQQEEKFNIYSHAIGILFAVAAFFMMLYKTIPTGNLYYIIGSLVYGVTLIMLYLASTLYHATRDLERRKRLKVFDHASIYGLIAGTYTPYLLITLHGAWGWSLLAVIWGVALGGIIFKLFFAGRFKLVSTIAYVVMGLIILVAIKPLYENLPAAGLTYLWLGGAFYIIGAVFYVLDKLPYNHAIFHVWVLLGSIAHFISIYYYVLPAGISR